MSLQDMARDLRKQHGCTSAQVKWNARLDRFVVRAVFSDELHDGTKFNRVALYDADGYIQHGD